MNSSRAGPWSRRSSNDTDGTSDTLTNFLNTTASSHRSSNLSLPFAEDAHKTIQQNEDEYAFIESIFYGEEPLPADKKTREEFKDWMETFKYLRISGRRCYQPVAGQCHRNPIYHEEIIASDPPLRTTGSRGGFLPVIIGSGGDGGERVMMASSSAANLRLPSIGSVSGNQRNSSKRISQTQSSSSSTLPALNVDKLITFGDLLTTRSISAAFQSHAGGGGGGTSRKWNGRR